MNSPEGDSNANQSIGPWQHPLIINGDTIGMLWHDKGGLYHPRLNDYLFAEWFEDFPDHAERASGLAETVISSINELQSNDPQTMDGRQTLRRSLQEVAFMFAKTGDDGSIELIDPGTFRGIYYSLREGENSAASTDTFAEMFGVFMRDICDKAPYARHANEDGWVIMSPADQFSAALNVLVDGNE